MSKHKHGYSWVIVNKHNAALMTYEFEAYFFTDKSDNTYYNTVDTPDTPLDIWTLPYSSKVDALADLNDFKRMYAIVGPIQDKWEKKIELTEEEQKLCKEYPSFGESFEGCTVKKSYGCYYVPNKKELKKRKQRRNARNRNRVRSSKSKK